MRQSGAGALEVVADGLRGLLPDDLGPWQQRNHRYGLKLWFGTAARPGRGLVGPPGRGAWRPRVRERREG